MTLYDVPYSLKFSRIKYFVVWLNSAQKQIFADKIFVVERESRKVHTYVYRIQQVLNFSRDKIFVVYL